MDRTVEPERDDPRKSDERTPTRTKVNPSLKTPSELGGLRVGLSVNLHLPSRNTQNIERKQVSSVPESFRIPRLERYV